MKRLFSKAAALLLMMVLTTATAWADELIYVGYLDPTAPIGMQRKTVLNPEEVSDQHAEIGSAGNETWYYVRGTVTNDNRIEVSGTVNLILADGCNFTASKGIHVASGNTLNIYAQSVANRGSLTASKTYNDAAIGGNGGEDCNDEYGTAGNGESSGKIAIYGGIITTTNGNIGGGNGGVGNATPSNGGDGGDGDVTIYSGIVTTGNYSIIGGGRNGYGLDENNATDNLGNDGGGTVTLSWADASDRIYSFYYFTSDYSVTLEKSFVDDNGDDVEAYYVNNKHIKPAGTPYTVSVSNSLPTGVAVSTDLPLNEGNRYAINGQTVTFSYTNNGVAAGYLQAFTVNYTNAYGDNTDDVIDNGDGTYCFWMPAADVTITAELKKDIANCTVTVPDQLPNGNSLIFYKFESANSGYAYIGETVMDGETKLTLGTDYEFGSVTFSNGNFDPYQVGDECRVEIRGKGDYAGTKWAYFTIVNPSGNGAWGDLTWSFANGELTISLTNPANGNKPMPGTTRENYPWHPYGSYITTISINEGVLNVADNAFAGTSNVSTYGGVTSVSLPSTLTGYKDNEDNDIPAIGDNAFAFCTGATISIPMCATTFGTTTPFNQVGCVVATLSDTEDNNALIGALSSVKTLTATLNGRTLYKDGNWNTLCLPFNMTNAQVTTLLAPNGLMELDTEGYYNINSPTTRYTYVYSEQEKKYVYIDEAATEYTGVVADLRQTGFDATSGALNLFFKDATSIEAGKPYLIKWDKADGYDQANPATRDIVNPEFTNLSGVTIETTPIAVTSPDGKVSFCGTYAQKTFTDVASSKTDDKSILFVGADNKLYYPISDGVNDCALNAFRAYFQLNGITVGDISNGVRMNFGEENEVNEVKEVLVQDKRQSRANDDSWYTLDGRKLVGKPTKKGMYIHNGNKVVIK